MERCSLLLYSLLIASGVLSSQVDGAREFGKRALNDLAVELSPVSSEVLGGNVTLYFHFPRNFTGFSSERTLSVLVYDNSTGKRLHTENLLLDRAEISVVLPCEIFDHPGLYRFKYRVSNSEFAAFISQTLTLKWGKILIQTPTNHTALTRFGSIWIRHNRKCLPKKYRDEVNLYYFKGHKKILVTRKYVRKVSSGKQRTPVGSWIRMGFACDGFDTQGSYSFEYRTGFANLTLAKSDAVHVHWGRQTLSPLANKIFPCTNSFTISFDHPHCDEYARTNDAIWLRDKYSDKIIAQKPVEQGHTVTFFQCSLFKDYVEEYCFDYVTYSSLTGGRVKVASLCLPTHPPGTSNYGGWSSWSPWTFCSSSCGEGKQHRYRYCLSVRTSQDKKSTCAGKALMSRSCALDPCPVSGSLCSCGCRLTEPRGMISSSPQLFPRLGSSRCTWVISLPVGSRVRLWFDALKMNGDSIIVRDGADNSAPQLVIIKDDKYKDAIISTGNSMYIFYQHNGIWTNGTRRGFTASYRTENLENKTSEATKQLKSTTTTTTTDTSKQLSKDSAMFTCEPKPKAAVRRTTLGRAEVTFLAVFVFAVLIFGVLLFIVFTKLRRHHKHLTSPSSGSSSTSESTLRSTGTPSPLADEASSSEPLKGCHNQKVKKDRKMSSHRKRTRRTEFLCDADRVPRCTCGEISELDSASGSNSASDCSPVRVINDGERVVERTARDDIPCDCPECLRFDRYPVGVSQEFRAPEKKYYGDWMLKEMPPTANFRTDPRIYRDSCNSYV